jgi:hypothetical protein
MRPILFVSILLLSVMTTRAQKVYTVEYQSQADMKVCVVEYESQAGWRNQQKKHLMY